jgi:hypothetical protein
MFSFPEGNVILNGRFEGKIAFCDEENDHPVGARFFSMIDYRLENFQHTGNKIFPTLLINGAMAIEYTDAGPKINNTSPVDLGIGYSLKC